MRLPDRSGMPRIPGGSACGLYPILRRCGVLSPEHVHLSCRSKRRAVTTRNGAELPALPSTSSKYVGPALAYGGASSAAGCKPAWMDPSASPRTCRPATVQNERPRPGGDCILQCGAGTLPIWPTFTNVGGRGRLQPQSPSVTGLQFARVSPAPRWAAWARRATRPEAVPRRPPLRRVEPRNWTDSRSRHISTSLSFNSTLVRRVP